MLSGLIGLLGRFLEPTGGTTAPTLISSVGSSMSAGTSSNISHTVAVGTDMIVVFAEFRDNPSTTTISTITYNGVGLTSAWTKVDTGTGDGVATYCFWLAAPATGLQTLAITLSASITSGRVQIHNVSGAHQTSPIHTGGSDTDTANTVSVVSMTSTVPVLFLWGHTAAGSGLAGALSGDGTQFELGDVGATATAYASAYYRETASGGSTKSSTHTIGATRDMTSLGVAIAGV